jgi:hypothetical protein
MGVPGDMNLELLDYVKLVSGLTWGLNLDVPYSPENCFNEG